jgi:serine-type D-Ala-D-Ala carboxypeptidase (penicillin-binding protein 5/6)
VGESTFSLQPGERLRVRELLTAALVQSANDAAYALANHVGRGKVERFVRWMNERASDLGLEQTHYVRPDGLDTKGHYSSALDTLTLAREAMKRKLFRKIVRTRSGVVSGRRLYVWNDLLRTYPGAIGIKTGHTDLAGWSEVAAAQREGVTLYAVLLGGPTRSRRNHDLAALLDWGFGHYGSVRVIAGGRTYATAGVPFSDDRVELLAETSARANVRLGRPLVERVVAPSQLEPPIGFGEVVGEVRIYDGDKLIAKRPLVASQAVGEPNLGKRVSWYAGRALDEAGDILASLSPF